MHRPIASTTVNYRLLAPSVGAIARLKGRLAKLKKAHSGLASEVIDDGGDERLDVQSKRDTLN